MEERNKEEEEGWMGQPAAPPGGTERLFIGKGVGGLSQGGDTLGERTAVEVMKNPERIA